MDKCRWLSDAYGDMSFDCGNYIYVGEEKDEIRYCPFCGKKTEQYKEDDE